MKKENKVWSLIGPIVVLVLIGGIITAALAFTNEVTAPIIAEQQAAAADAALLEVLPEGASFTDVALEGLPDAVMAVKQAGNGAGYVVTTQTNGFGGAIQAMFGINADGAITGSKVLVHGETEGIGSRVVQDGSDWQQQIVGMSGGDVDSIVATSGASVSSGAMKNAVKAVFDAYTILTGGTVEVPEAVLYEASPNLTDEAIAEFLPGASFTDVPGGKVSDAGTVVYGAAQGFASQVMVAVCFDANDAIVGVIADVSGETPGIGSLAGEKSYTDQFIGVASADEVDTLSGATFASGAVKEAVNLAIANLNTVKGAG